VLSEERVLTLVGRIYDAVADGELWHAFLQDFADAVHGTTTAILFYDWSVPGARVDAAIRWDPEFSRRYRDYYNTVNPWIKSWKANLNLAGPDSITASEQLVELSVLEKTEFYNDYLLPQNTVHQMACMITKAENTGSAFACMRQRETGPFGRAEIELLRALFPHLQRGMQFYKRMASLEGQYRASLDALNRLPMGVVLIDEQGRVLEKNRAADRILGQNDGLTIEKGRLLASSSLQNKELYSLTTSAALTGQRKGTASGGSLGINRPSGRRPFGLIVMPVSPHAAPADSRRPAAIVFMNDPEAKLHVGPEFLGQVYDLTRAESRLAELLIQGESLVHAAVRLGVSHNTARTHLQRIYEKTGTGHQGELVRLLLAGLGNLLPTEPGRDHSSADRPIVS
jgi:DNA-binding CsgD family transcriptional regulator/PAS domain-containing protein